MNEFKHFAEIIKNKNIKCFNFMHAHSVYHST